MRKQSIYTALIAFLLAAGAMTGSCRKPAPEPEPGPQPPEPEDIVLTVNAKMEIPDGSGIDLSMAEWGAEKQMTLWVSDSKNDERLTASASDESGNNFKFGLSSAYAGKELKLGAFYPTTAASSKSEDFRAVMPSVQKGSEGTFDPDGLMFVATPASLKMPSEGGEAEWEASFHTISALNILTIKGIDGPVNSVEITAPTGVALAGGRELDMEEGAPGEITEGTNSIRITYSPALEADGSAVVNFASWDATIPAGAEISVTVNGTESTTITAEAPINLFEGRVNKLTAEIEGEVTPPTDELEGCWLVGAADSDGNWVLMTPEADKSFFNGLSTNVSGDIWSISGGNFAGVSGIESCVWTIARCGEGYSMMSTGGKYLGIYGAKKVGESDSAFELSITRNSDGTVSISLPGNSGYGELKYNISAPRFTTYTSSSSTLPLVSLIPWDKEIGPSIIIDNPSAIVDAEATSVSFKYTAVGIGSAVSATVSQDPDGIVRSISAASGTLRVELNPNSEQREKEAHVILSAEGISAEASITQRAYLGGGGGDIPGDQPGWLELPAYLGTEDYIKTLYAGKDRNYSYWYEVDWYSSMWIAYPLYADTMGSGRSDNWAANPQIPESEQINVWDGSYGVNVSGTIYSRGHQIANSDRNGNSTMQRQTFYATNSTPQIQDRFNGGIWNSLENAIQDVASGKDTVYVVTGPTFKTVGGNEEVKWIQPKHDSKKAPVPNYYWKAVLKVKRSGGTVTDAMAVGFWFEHRQYTDKYENYAVSVDEIERLTGLDLFTNLPESVESKAETNSSWSSFRNF